MQEVLLVASIVAIPWSVIFGFRWGRRSFERDLEWGAEHGISMCVNGKFYMVQTERTGQDGESL